MSNRKYLPIVVLAGQLKHHIAHHLNHVNARLADHDQHRSGIDLPESKDAANIAAHHTLRIRTDRDELDLELMVEKLRYMAGHRVVQGCEGCERVRTGLVRLRWLGKSS